MNTEQILTWMKRELTFSAEDFVECGEVISTKLGEAYADAFDIGEEIPDEVWDAAHEAAVWWEEAT